MKPSMLIISGWAHGLEAIRPLGRAFETDCAVELRTGAEILQAGALPDAEVILSGSMGGLLAMEHLPAACRKLVLLSSTARFCATEGYPHGTSERVLKRMIRQLERDPEQVLQAFYANVHDPHEPLPTDPGCGLDELVQGLTYLQEADLRERIPYLDVPTLLLHGTEDRIIPVGAAEWLADHLPQAWLERVPDEGHALAAHRFEMVVTRIRRFLEVSPSDDSGDPEYG